MITYGVALTAGGHPFAFHVPNLQSVRELYVGSTNVTSFRVWEETYTMGEGTTFREMSQREVIDTISL